MPQCARCPSPITNGSRFCPQCAAENKVDYPKRTQTGWSSKLEALRERAPVLDDENPISVGSRKFDCRRYEKCLDYAIAQDWLGFHCENCEVEDEYTRDEKIERARESFQEHSPLSDEQLPAMPDEESENVEDVLSAKDAAAELGVSVQWVKKLVKEGKVKSLSRADVEAYKAEAPAAKRTRPAPAPVVAPEVLARVRWLVEGAKLEAISADDAISRIGELVG